MLETVEAKAGGKETRKIRKRTLDTIDFEPTL
jgi:hypothetical protein